MDFQYTPADETFRNEVRAFVSRELPDEVARRFKRGWRWTRPEMEFWTRKLNQRGWSAPNWPVRYGGTGWTPVQKHIFEVETWRAGAPPTHNQNFDLVGPIIYTYGTEEQIAAYLPPILSGDAFWAQGFSEPGAGSDLAGLKTSAIRHADHYVVNGQKIWTSDAEACDGVFTLVRTDPAAAKPQAGISFLLIDLSLPGITIRPIEMMNGERHLNEVFFDDVRVPVACLVGEENKGWSYTKFLLAHERTASARVFEMRRDLELLKSHACTTGYDRFPGLLDRIASLEIEILTLEYAVLRVLTETPDAPSMHVASVLKIRGSELLQETSSLLAEILGPYADVVYPVPEDWSEPWLDELPGPDWASGVTAGQLHRQAATIYGGSNEIQRNIIARNVLRSR